MVRPAESQTASWFNLGFDPSANAGAGLLPPYGRSGRSCLNASGCADIFSGLAEATNCCFPSVALLYQYRHLRRTCDRGVRPISSPDGSHELAAGPCVEDI
jgi:hypothetical protein